MAGDREPTIGEVLDGESLDDLRASLTGSWLDSHITRVWDRAHAMRHHAKKNGIVLGSMDAERALALIEATERDVAEIRAALQERVRDQKAAD